MSDVGTRPGVIKSDRQDMRMYCSSRLCGSNRHLSDVTLVSFPRTQPTPDSGDDRGIFEFAMP